MPALTASDWYLESGDPYIRSIGPLFPEDFAASETRALILDGPLVPSSGQALTTAGMRSILLGRGLSPTVAQLNDAVAKIRNRGVYERTLGATRNLYLLPQFQVPPYSTGATVVPGQASPSFSSVLQHIAGPQGEQGPAGTGERGLTGPAGPQGPAGPAGADGSGTLSDLNPFALGSTSPGVSEETSRYDHVHAHGDQAGGTLHATVVASGAAGFMTGADKAKLDGIAAGAVADHGALTGLTDDDHAQYILTTGARAFTGGWTVNAASPTTVVGNGTGSPARVVNRVSGGSAVDTYQIGGVRRFEQTFASSNFTFVHYDTDGTTVLSSTTCQAAGTWIFPSNATFGLASVGSFSGTPYAATPSTTTQTGTSVSGGSVAHRLYVNDGSRNTRAQFFLHDDVTLGNRAWGHWLTWGSSGSSPYVIGIAAQEHVRLTTGAPGTFLLTQAQLHVGDGTGGPVVRLQKADASSGDIELYSNGVHRATLRLNSSENFQVIMRDGTGAVTGSTTFVSADGEVQFPTRTRWGGSSGPFAVSGTGSPEGAVTAPIGSLYLRTDGSTDTAVYRKETGAGNTGWVPITTPLTTEQIQDIVAAMATEGHGIDLVYDDGAGTLTIAVDESELDATLITGFTEAAQDAVAGALTDSSTIDFTYNDVANTITAAVIPGGIDATTLANFTEGVQDVVGAMATEGNGIDLVYNDAGGTLTFTVDESELSATAIGGFNEAVDDRVAGLLVAGTNITLTYDDVANTLTIDSAGGGTTQEQVEDWVGNLVQPGNEINVTYDDVGNQLTIDVNYADDPGLSVFGNYTNTATAPASIAAAETAGLVLQVVQTASEPDDFELQWQLITAVNVETGGLSASNISSNGTVGVVGLGTGGGTNMVELTGNPLDFLYITGAGVLGFTPFAEIMQDALAGSIGSSNLDVTYDDPGGTVQISIPADAVSNALLANMAANTVKVNATTGSANPTDLAMGVETVLGRPLTSGNIQALTRTQLTALSNVFTSALPGDVPASGGGTTNFLRADGTWTAPAGGTGATLTRIAGNSGAAGADLTWQYLSSNAASNNTTTLATVMTTTGVGAGLWRFRYTIRYQAAATTTGIGIAVNHTNTTTTFLTQSWFTSTGGAAATGVNDQVTAVNAGQMVEGKAERVKNTVSSATAGVDTANADCMLILEGMVRVSVSGSLELRAASEVAASAITVMADTTLELHFIG